MTVKKILILTGIAVCCAAFSPAQAAIYNYKTYISNGIGSTNITIDTNAKTATFKGKNIDLVMTDHKLSSFKGGHLPGSHKTPTYTVDSISGTFSRYGRDYTAYWSSKPKHTQFEIAKNRSFLWMYGRDAWGRTYDFDGKGSYTKYTGSTGGSTGGTPVPEPGMFGLLGLGLGGLWFARRRKSLKGAASGQPAFA